MQINFIAERWNFYIHKQRDGLGNSGGLKMSTCTHYWVFFRQD